MPHQLGLSVWAWASEPGGLPVLPALLCSTLPKFARFCPSSPCFSRFSG